jgi:hypothetical protein
MPGDDVSKSIRHIGRIRPMTEDLERQLTRLYVALAMTRNVAQRAKDPDEASRSVVTLVDVASGIVEEILNPPLSYSMEAGTSITEIELLM